MVARTNNHSSNSTRDRHSTDSDFADLMEDPHCRYLLDYLQRAEGDTQVSAASRYVVAEMTGGPPDGVPESAQRRAQTWFHHGLLPELDEKDLVDFDPEAGTVRLAERSSK
jgi:hypothetical protein